MLNLPWYFSNEFDHYLEFYIILRYLKKQKQKKTENFPGFHDCPKDYQ